MKRRERDVAWKMLSCLLLCKPKTMILYEAATGVVDDV